MPVHPTHPTPPAPANGSQRVLLNNPPATKSNEPDYDTPKFGCPALVHLAGYLRRATDCEIALVDSKLERLDFKRTLERIEEFRPDVVGFTAFTCEIKAAARMAKLVRGLLPGVVTVIGGVHVTALPRETLVEFPEFDVAVCGEGEVTFAELCRALDAGTEITGIDGLACRESGRIRLTNPRERILDLDALPLPAWDLLPRASRYVLQTIRGCPFACKFCMNPNGKAVRARSVENVIAELEWIITAWEPAEVYFGDEIFTVDLDRTKAILRAVIDRGFHESVEWSCLTHVRFVDDELFALMGKLKVDYVGLGIETGDEAVLKKIGKGTSLDMIVKARNLARKHGVPVMSLMVFGHPNETAGSIWNTVKLAVRLNAEIPVFNVMTPYPGTEVAMMAARGEGGYRLVSADWGDYQKQFGGALEFAKLRGWHISALQLCAYTSVFLWNLRFLDLARFVWRHWPEGLAVAARMVRGLLGSASPASAREPSEADTRAIAESFDVWQKWQVSELGRARRSGRRQQSA